MISVPFQHVLEWDGRYLGRLHYLRGLNKDDMTKDEIKELEMLVYSHIGFLLE
jgi:hypothetical protein